jgi:hypothetical protein
MVVLKVLGIFFKVFKNFRRPLPQFFGPRDTPSHNIWQQAIREFKEIYGKRISKKLYFGNNVCVFREIKNRVYKLKQQTQKNELYPVTANYKENNVSPSV